MDEQNQPRLDQWTDFAGKFLKAEFVDKFPLELVCDKVYGEIDTEGQAHLFLEFGYKNKRWTWEMNKTNQKVIKDAGIKAPIDLFAKKITFESIKVRNPSTKQMVDSLAISKIQ